MILADDLDRALESCERAVIEAHLAEAGTARTLRYWLSQALGNEAYGEELAAACERLDVGKDEIIAAQGEPERRRFMNASSATTYFSPRLF
ncbi:MAG: hypothetical protein WA717_14815 [Methyloceanibacter sp.]